ncbi:SDR family NAD(P)-dependent oxidoreductase, partial [Oleiagrimonas citrea]
AVGQLWRSGIEPDWAAFYREERRLKVSLPTYVFDRQRYWVEAATDAVAETDAGEVSLINRLMIEAEKLPLADSFFVPSWKRAGTVDGALEAATPEDGSCWLIFADANGIGDALAAAVKPLGIESVLVRQSETFSVAEDGSLMVRVSEREDYTAVLKELKQRKLTPHRIVHLWATEEWNADLEGPLQKQLDAGFYSLFHMAQEIGERLSDTPIELCIVASDLEPVLGTETIHPIKATLRGPCKVIRQEFATIACRSIDLFSSEEEDLGAEHLGSRLAAEILSGGEDQFAAFREGERWVPFAEPVRIDAPQDAVPRLKEAGVYLITGGLGGIGLAFAEYLYRTKSAKLVLLGRSGLPPREEWDEILAANAEDRITERVRKVHDLTEAGAEVLLITADVADAEQMEAAVREAVQQFGAIDGVIHAAGLPGQGLTQLKTVPAVAQVMAPKIQGTLALDRALTRAGVELDFLLLVSSVAAIVGGGPGQIDYCAANAFLDAFAQRHRHRHGLTVSINFGEWQWDAWSDGLKGYQPEMQKALRKHRQQFGITFEEGMEGTRRILALDMPQVIFFPEDAADVIASSNACVVSNISSAVQQTRGRRPTAYPRPALANQFVEASNELERTIAAIWQRALGIDQIGTKDNFFDLGGNSLVGLQVIAELRKELDVELRQVVLYEAPTIDALVRYLSPEAEEPAGEDASKLFAERRERARTDGRASHDIALVGMSGRFPDASTPQQLWKNISAGTEAVTFYTDSELREAGVTPAEFGNPNYVRAGYDIEDFDLFDARLFGYAPREAEFIDPQHRQFLECAWEALEDAACDPESYNGLIGIFAGSSGSAYTDNLLSRPDIVDTGVDMLQVVVGNSNDALATRVAYKLNLRGPAMSVQTFCSTSGVAMHSACKSLLYGECDIAMAGGVHIAISGKAGYMYTEGGITPPDGHTRTFDADAKGAVLGDGVAVVVFKRLEDALADGDHIYAVVKGSAMNNDGSFKVGYTAPSVEGQAAVVTEALAAADVPADSIRFIETHGTATELGDPI